MTLRKRRGRSLRVSAARRHERGMTLVELLLAVSILMVLTTFLVGGLAMARRASDADRANDISAGTDMAIQVVANLIGSALPVQDDLDVGRAMRFDGRAETLSFIGLSEGRSLPGGLHAFDLRGAGRDLIVNLASPDQAKGKRTEPARLAVPVLRDVRRIRFRYFGSKGQTSTAEWRDEWVQAARLPSLISMQVEFGDERRNRPPTMVALRQR